MSDELPDDLAWVAALPEAGSPTTDGTGSSHGTPRHGADGFLMCSCGQRHWGLNGAAGLLLWHDGKVLLQHRSEWSHHGSTWAFPGGAIDWDETPVEGALREFFEETGIAPESVEVLGTHAYDHLDWRYTSVVGRLIGPEPELVLNSESLELRWIPWEDVPDLPLLEDFRSALDALTARRPAD